MTTPAAANYYLALHQLELEGRRPTIFNPKSLPLEELPVIYGFNNGGSPGWYNAVAIAEDGNFLGGHLCSHEAYMESDLGILEGCRPDRHKNDYQPHYPDGYRMEWVPTEQLKEHEAFNKAFERFQKKEKAAQDGK